MKTSFVQINGQLWQKTGDNAALVAGEMWYRIAGRWEPASGSQGQAPMVMPDIQPYRSTIDGSLIESRSTHRAHLREHNCIEVGNERPKPQQETWTATRGLREELAARLNG